MSESGLSHSWTEAQSAPPLHEGVHVWRTQLHLPGDDDWALLSEDERARARRFKFAEHAERFVARRAFLRRLLASYLGGCEAEELRFEYGEMGKPKLEAPNAHLHFNMASSHDLCVVAVTREGQVGIDIEKRRGIADLAALAETSFSVAELEEFRAVAPSDRERAFFDGWTRKEAFIKAIGAGLAFPLRDFDVSLGKDAARIQRIAGVSASVNQWTLAPLEPAPGYAAAVCVDQPGARVYTFAAEGLIHL